ncbi:MAG: GGDEF domain-containing protein [Ramlibacter sp.]|nr:diguanylate cyclase [Ramlibacter sp.]
MKTTTLQGPAQVVTRAAAHGSAADWRAFPLRSARWMRRLAAMPAMLGATCNRIRREARSAHGGVDARTGLYNFEGLMDAAELLLERANAECRPLSVVVLEFSDLREVRQIYEPATCDRLIAKVVRKLDTVAGLGGLAGRTGTTQFTLVIQEPPARAQERLRRVLGKPARIEFEAADSEIVLVPELMLASTSPDVESVEAVWRQMCRELAQARMDEARRQHYLQKERERHSRPMAPA